MRSCNQNLSISCCFTGNKLKFCPEAPSLSVSCCVKSAARKPLVQTARFNLILRQDKLYKAAFSAPVSPEKRALQLPYFPKGGPRKPLPKGGGSLLVLPQKRGEGPSLFPPAGGLRKPPCFSQKEGLEILLTSPLFRPLSCPLGRAFSPPSSPSCAKKKTGEQPLAPGKDLLRPAGGQGRTKEPGPKQRVPFKGFPSGLRWFRTIPEECPDPVGKVFRPARGGVQAYPACGAYRRMKKETGKSPVSFGFGWGGGAKRGDRAGLPFSFGSEALSPRPRSFGRPRRPPDRPPTTGRGGPR